MPVGRSFVQFRFVDVRSMAHKVCLGTSNNENNIAFKAFEQFFASSHCYDGGVCVCVCVCVERRKREQKKESGKKIMWHGPKMLKSKKELQAKTRQ